ncbi:hypothetical protein MBLNU13_g03457t1 [Cladosporium sp. NU13]
MACTADEMYAGDGCHPDEAQALSDYLHGIYSEQETAKRTTAAIVNEKIPSQETYRLWALLSEALVELSESDRQKTLDLLAHIRTLPSALDCTYMEGSGLGCLIWKAQMSSGEYMRPLDVLKQRCWFVD